MGSTSPHVPKLLLRFFFFKKGKEKYNSTSQFASDSPSHLISNLCQRSFDCYQHCQSHCLYLGYSCHGN